jgi:hypothetical protein
VEETADGDSEENRIVINAMTIYPGGTESQPLTLTKDNTGVKIFASFQLANAYFA